MILTQEELNRNLCSHISHGCLYTLINLSLLILPLSIHIVKNLTQQWTPYSWRTQSLLHTLLHSQITAILVSTSNSCTFSQYSCCCTNSILLLLQKMKLKFQQSIHLEYKYKIQKCVIMTDPVTNINNKTESDKPCIW